jgi:hypothetical protein
MSSRISQDRLVETGVHSPLTDKQPVTVGLGRQFAFGERLPGRVYSRSPTRLVGFTHFVGDRDTLYYPGQPARGGYFSFGWSKLRTDVWTEPALPADVHLIVLLAGIRR